ncbi:28149_t:CDS:2, partial [Racocetra persica]
SKNKIEKNNSKIGKVDKAIDEPVNNFIERVPSNLTEEDFLPSINEILKPSVTQSSHPSKETNLLHPKIVDTETSIEGSNRNDVLAILSIINGQESSTPPPNITKKNSSDVLMHYQHTYETENDIRQYPYVLIESVDTNSSSTKVIEQSSDSFSTATTTDNTEFLHEIKKRKNSDVSNNKKGKQRMQYSLTEADLDEHKSISSNSEELQTSGRLIAKDNLLKSYLK